MGVLSEAARMWRELKRCEPDDFITDCYLNTPKPVPTGIAGLDEALSGGIMPGLTYIAGQPGAGKSALGLDVAAAAAISEGGVPVVYFSLEMGYAQCRMRLLSWLAYTFEDEYGLEPFVWSAWRAPGDVTTPEALRYTHDPIMLANDAWEASGLNKRLRIVDDTHDVNDICDIVSTLCSDGRRPLVVIDYLQIVEAEGASEYERVTNASHALAKLAKDNYIPIIAITSMNREQGRAEGKGRPAYAIASARGSGHTEYDAQALVRLVTKSGGKVYITVPKNRSGKRCESPVPLIFDGEHHVFLSPEGR